MGFLDRVHLKIRNDEMVAIMVVVATATCTCLGQLERVLKLSWVRGIEIMSLPGYVVLFAMYIPPAWRVT